ncbi:MAG TPA: M57 family metalloprotease, partial [Steroidobacteraceae bacterium]|nr:M57 family metalloprotease [Steroidobacteraceae bacterium]
MVRFLVAALLLLSTGPAFATTFVVPSDAQLIEEADSIVVGMVQEVVARAGAGGSIYTHVTIRASEILKGSAEPVVRVKEEGGLIQGRGVYVPGTPIYKRDEHVLVFLSAIGDGTYRTVGKLLGKFTYRDTALQRGSNEHGVFGITADGLRHREVSRAPDRFLRFIRARLTRQHGAADYFLTEQVRTGLRIGADSNGVEYALSPPARWNNGAAATFTANPNRSTGERDWVGASRRALAAWSDDAGSSVSFTFGGVVPAPYVAGDGKSSITFNIPWSEFGGGIIALATLSTEGTHEYPGAGAEWRTITEGDVRVSEFVNGLSQMTIDAIVAHELGHTLGFRHSDYGSPSAIDALMASAVVADRGAVLGLWDRDALSHLYGARVTVCEPVSFMAAPLAMPPVVLTGESALLTVSATGAGPLTYEWYTGRRGETMLPMGATPAIVVSPSTTNSYWVRVRNSCGIAVDSIEVHVAVGDAPPCIPARIRTPLSDVTIPVGHAAQL